VANAPAIKGNARAPRPLRAAPITTLPQSNDELLVRAGQGDQAAYAELYDVIAPVVFGLAKRVTRDHQLAEDVAQEALVEVWRQAPRYDPTKGKAMTWVATIAHRRAIDRVRAEQSRHDREHRVAVDLQTNTTGDEVSAGVLRQATAQQVEQALAVLTASQSEVIKLAFYDGRTYAEVAELLSIPLGTAKTRIRDGLLRLRDSATLTRDAM
jgi:RNA polymerase sigma-70 factor, ECF subfamily